MTKTLYSVKIIYLIYGFNHGSLENHLFVLLPGPVLPGVIVPIKVPSMKEIELFDHVTGLPNFRGLTQIIWWFIFISRTFTEEELFYLQRYSRLSLQLQPTGGFLSKKFPQHSIALGKLYKYLYILSKLL